MSTTASNSPFNLFSSETPQPTITTTASVPSVAPEMSVPSVSTTVPSGVVPTIVSETIPSVATTATNTVTDTASTIASTTSTGISSITNSPWFWILILIILLTGIATYILYILAETNKIAQDIFGFFGIVIGNTAKQVTSTASKGADVLIDSTSNALKKGVDIVENTVEKTADILGDRRKNNGKVRRAPRPDESSSPIQKSGYCLVGKDRGHRSCVYVGRNDKCLSGDIYPTQEICINPKLRV